MAQRGQLPVSPLGMPPELLMATDDQRRVAALGLTDPHYFHKGPAASLGSCSQSVTILLTELLTNCAPIFHVGKHQGISSPPPASGSEGAPGCGRTPGSRPPWQRPAGPRRGRRRRICAVGQVSECLSCVRKDAAQFCPVLADRLRYSGNSFAPCNRLLFSCASPSRNKTINGRWKTCAPWPKVKRCRSWPRLRRRLAGSAESRSGRAFSSCWN